MGNGRPENSSLCRRFASPLMLAGLVALTPCMAGCRTSESDVQRWASTAQGPARLVAVMIHAKYPEELRTKAALALIQMRPRGGQRVGITKLVEALQQMPRAERERAVSRLIPHLVEGMAKAPSREGGQRVDESVAYKDAAYALLSSEGGPFVDPPSARKLEAALGQWVYSDFEGRIEDPSQAFGVEQMMRRLGAAGVARLSELITRDSEKVDRIAGLVAELGDAPAKARASGRLVDRTRYVASAAWTKTQEPAVREQNAKAKLAPTEEQLRKQIEQYQEEQVLRLYSTLKRIGQKPAIEFLLGEAENPKLEEKRRATALAALEGNIDKRNRPWVDRLLDIASAAETPDKVRDVALRRVGELPRELVVDRLYGLFTSENWKIRWVAAELILQLSDQSHLEEFMSRLSQVSNMAITEPLRYGDLLGKLKGKASPRALVEKYARPAERPAVRVSALGFYYEHGTPADLAALEAYAGDREKVPGCARDATDCEWKCTLAGELREIETVGDFVEYCVKPAVKVRKPISEGTKRSNKHE
jgi:hypothetical protein